MKQTKHKWQQGFAIVELAIFVIAIIAVGGIGYWALTRSKAADMLTTRVIAEPRGDSTYGPKLQLENSGLGTGKYRVNIAGPNGWIRDITNPDGSVMRVTSADGTTLEVQLPKWICSRLDNKIDGGTAQWVSANISACNSASTGYTNAPIQLTNGSKWTISLTADTVDHKEGYGADPLATMAYVGSEFFIGANYIGNITPNIGVKVGDAVVISHRNDTTFATPTTVYLRSNSVTVQVAKITTLNANGNINLNIPATATSTNGTSISLDSTMEWNMQLESNGIYGNSFRFTTKSSANPTPTPPIPTPTITVDPPLTTPTPTPKAPSITLNVSQPKAGSKYVRGDNLTIAWETNTNQKGNGYYEYFLRNTSNNKEYSHKKITASGKSFSESIKLSSSIPLGSYIAVVQLWQNNIKQKSDTTHDFSIMNGTVWNFTGPASTSDSCHDWQNGIATNFGAGDDNQKTAYGYGYTVDLNNAGVYYYAIYPPNTKYVPRGGGNYNTPTSIIKAVQNGTLKPTDRLIFKHGSNYYIASWLDAGPGATGGGRWLDLSVPLWSKLGIGGYINNGKTNVQWDFLNGCDGLK